MTTVSFSLNRLDWTGLDWTGLDSVSSRSCSDFICRSFSPLTSPLSVCSRRVTVMTPGRCGTRTPQGAPTTTTGHPIQRPPRLGRLPLTPGAPYPRATLRLTRAPVRPASQLATIRNTLCVSTANSTAYDRVLFIHIKYNSYSFTHTTH